MATRVQIKESVEKLRAAISKERALVLASSNATAVQKAQAHELVDELQFLLGTADAHVELAAEEDFNMTWNDWVEQSIAPNLKQLSQVMSQVFGSSPTDPTDPPGPGQLGRCQYPPDNEICVTQAECTMPDGVWTAGGCT